MRLNRTVSQMGVFRAVLGMRWFLLAAIPVQIALAQGGTNVTVAASALVIAISYTLLLTLNARRALAHLNANLGFAAVDMAIGLALYATGEATDWVFYAFSVTSLFMVGVRGRVREGVVAAVLWNVLATACQYAWRLPASQVFGIVALEDLLNLSIGAAIWAYAASLVLKLNTAYDELKTGADALSGTNARLDEGERVILGLMDAGDAIVNERDLDVILGTVVGALSGVGFGPCRVWTLDAGAFRAVFPSGELVPDVASVSGSPLADAVGHRRPVSIPPGRGASLPGFDPSKLAIAVPVLSKDEPLGVLVIESVSGEPFDEVDLELLNVFADQIALAIQHARLYARTQELAVAEERSRITRQIHDTVVQRVYGASLAAESLRIGPVASTTAEKVRALQESVLASLRDLRFAVLNWDSLEWRAGLGDAVERYAAETSALTGIAVSVVLRGDDCQCRTAAATDVLRVLQAALSNVWHHAHARAVHVDLACGASGMTLIVRDDGRGFDVSEVGDRPSGGIVDMRRLGQRNKGWVDIASAPGDGTQVRLWLPC